MKRLLATAALLVAGAANAADYTEVGDAGQTLGSTQSVIGSGSVNNIYGTLATEQDADLFRIYIANPAIFSAVASSPGDAVDTQLFLLDASGHAIATNDDSSGLSFQAALPMGNALYSGLAAGFYLLGVANSGNEPVNVNNQTLFATGGGTAVRGAAGGRNPTTLSDFDSFAYSGAGTGAYGIALNGVTAGPAAVGGVPEPTTWAMMIGGFGLVGGAMRRRRTQVAYG